MIRGLAMVVLLIDLILASGYLIDAAGSLYSSRGNLRVERRSEAVERNAPRKKNGGYDGGKRGYRRPEDSACGEGYADRPVEREKLDAILEAATYAPTGMGAQSPVIVLVESKEVRDKVAALNAGVMGRDIDPFYGAPAVAIVFGHRGAAPTWFEDACLVAGNLLNAAHAVGGRLVLHLSCQGGLRDRRGSGAFEGVGPRR